jgi:hypothetical protein
MDNELLSELIDAGLRAGMKTDYLTRQPDGSEPVIYQKFAGRFRRGEDGYILIDKDGNPVENNMEPVTVRDFIGGLRHEDNGMFPEPDTSRELSRDEKIEYINRHGFNGYVAMRTGQKRQEVNPKDWSAREKSEYIAKHGDAAFMELMRKHKRTSKLKARR